MWLDKLSKEQIAKAKAKVKAGKVKAKAKAKAKAEAEKVQADRREAKRSEVGSTVYFGSGRSKLLSVTVNISCLPVCKFTQHYR